MFKNTPLTCGKASIGNLLVTVKLTDWLSEVSRVTHQDLLLGGSQPSDLLTPPHIHVRSSVLSIGTELVTSGPPATAEGRGATRRVGP